MTLHKSLATFIVAILIGAILAVPVPAALGWQSPPGADSEDWYMTVDGVLDSDTYDLYPFDNTKSLSIGFSKFGEFINAIEQVGLEYGREVDAFAPPGRDTVLTQPGWNQPEVANKPPWDIPQNVWFSGWLINISYVHATATPRNRTVWATAQHAFLDTSGYGNAWVRVDNGYADVDGGKIQKSSNDVEGDEDPLDPGCFLNEDGSVDMSSCSFPSGVNSGRVTNGTVVTQPIEILYDGPRRFIGRISHTIYDVLSDSAFEGDGFPAGTVPLVHFTITIDFNKVKKEIILFKDVKQLEVKFQYSTAWIHPEEKCCHYGKGTDHNDQWNARSEGLKYSGMYVQLSNRDEWDLGPDPLFNSYAHFYTDGTAPNDGQNEGMHTVYGKDYALIRTAPINKYAAWGVEPDETVDTYDVAQIISEGEAYVGWAAFWPSLSDWSVQGVTDDLYWRSISANDPHAIDMDDEPFRSPYTIGEWDFILTHPPKYDNNYGTGFESDAQFHGVTKYGLTDNHPVPDKIDAIDPADEIEVGNGKDADMADGYNRIDREVYYQLKENFVPWDLIKSVHKQTERQVYFWEADGEAGFKIPIEMTPVYVPGIPPFDHHSYHQWSNWWGYPNFDDQPPTHCDEGCIQNSARFLAAGFAERIINKDTGELLERHADYEINAHGEVEFTEIPEEGTVFKILFSRLGATSYKLGPLNPTELIYKAGDPPTGMNTTDNDGLPNDEPIYWEEIDILPFSPVRMAIVHLNFTAYNMTTGEIISNEPMDFILYRDKPVDERTRILKTNTLNVTVAMDSDLGDVIVRLDAIDTDIYEKFHDANINLTKTIKGFHWMQSKHQIFDAWVDVTDCEMHCYGGMNGKLYYWPLTTAEVIVQFINSTDIAYQAPPPEPGMGPYGYEWDGPFEGMQIRTEKFMLDKYQPWWLRNSDMNGADSHHVNEVNIDFGSGDFFIEFVEGVDNNGATSLRVHVKIVYTPVLGTYEWISVGRNAMTIPDVVDDHRGALNVDSIGAAMVAQAFDSLKNIHVKWGALDLADPQTLLAISLLRQFDPEDNTRVGYLYDGLNDNRTALKDDWSSSVPISSSNIITVGGPVALANVVAEYFNEFTPVIWRGMPWYKPHPAFGEKPVFGERRDLFPVSGYGLHQGTSTEDGPYNLDPKAVHENTGYAVVATYLDINGTEGFMVYGLTGNDTFVVASAMFNAGRHPAHTLLNIYDIWQEDTFNLGDIDSSDPWVAIPIQDLGAYKLGVGPYEGNNAQPLTPICDEAVFPALRNGPNGFDLPRYCSPNNLIEYLQIVNPGITAIVIEIDYSVGPASDFTDDIHPDLYIVEHLGIISEKPQHDP